MSVSDSENYDISATIEAFFSDCTKTPNDSIYSWNHCYEFFGRAAYENRDLACLHLGFFLASWGMYRGSAKIRDFDYKVYRPAVDTILDENFRLLRGATLDVLTLEGFDILWNLVGRLRNDAQCFPDPVSRTDTLVTKILMGTLGCTPAYDRFFRKGLEEHDLPQTFTPKYFKRVLAFCAGNESHFNEVADEIKEFPFMRRVDMYFNAVGNLKDKA